MAKEQDVKEAIDRCHMRIYGSYQLLFAHWKCLMRDEQYRMDLMRQSRLREIII
jgi:hypothetical protein